jgi:hypothetical protein
MYLFKCCSDHIMSSMSADDTPLSCGPDGTPAQNGPISSPAHCCRPRVHDGPALAKQKPELSATACTTYLKEHYTAQHYSYVAATGRKRLCTGSHNASHMLMSADGQPSDITKSKISKY